MRNPLMNEKLHQSYSSDPRRQSRICADVSLLQFFEKKSRNPQNFLAVPPLSLSHPHETYECEKAFVDYALKPKPNSIELKAPQR